MSNDMNESSQVRGQENEIDRNEISKETGQKKMVRVSFSLSGDNRSPETFFGRGKLWK